jgi:hypothetical protein
MKLWQNIALALLGVNSCVLAADSKLPVQLLAPLEFSASTITSVTPSAITRLLNQKVKLGSQEPDAYEFLVLPDSTNRVRVETANEYIDALKKGACPYTTFDVTMDSWFQRTAGSLKFIERSTPSTQSLLPTDLLEFSVEILGSNDPDERDKLSQDARKGISLRDYAKSGKVQKVKASKHQLRLETDTEELYIQEMARGDFDRDGFEDALIFVTSHYKEGSGRGFVLFVAHKTDSKARFCSVQAFSFN